MGQEWQTFVEKFDDMVEGEEELFIKDLTPGQRKYEARHVRARISKTRENLPDGDTLWVRSESGLKYPEPWFIKVLEELPEWVAGKPWENVLKAIQELKKGKRPRD
jgi:hypothetical protein